jgi:hypothetical protein
MERSRRPQSRPAAQPAAPTSQQQPVTRNGAGGYTYRLHADGRVEIVRPNRSIFVTAESNPTAHAAIIAEVGAYPVVEAPAVEETSETPFLDGVEAEQEIASEALSLRPEDVTTERRPEVEARVDREATVEADGEGFFDRVGDLLGGLFKRRGSETTSEVDPGAVATDDRDVHSMNRQQLATILASPEAYGFSVWAAAHARDRMLEHQQAVDADGIGTIEGIHTEDKTAGAEREDCTTYVLETLGAAFQAAGQQALWNQVKAEASRNSGSGGFKGIELMKALQNRAGWKSLFWAADTQTSADGDAEHTFAASVAERRGTYYGAEVEDDLAVTNYRRTEEGATADLTGIESLQQLPFGVLAARGGTHMALLLNGAVYEVHWDWAATDRDVVEATPLENWGWLSGMVTAPAADLDRAFAG